LSTGDRVPRERLGLLVRRTSEISPPGASQPVCSCLLGAHNRALVLKLSVVAQVDCFVGMYTSQNNTVI